MINVVEGEPGDGEGSQVVITPGRLDLSLQLGACILEGPRNESREPAASVLQVAHPEQVCRPCGYRLADPEHHRRSRAKANRVGVSVDRQPLIGRSLGPRPNLTTGFVLENLSTAGVPMHAGCVKYWEDKGVKIPKALIPPEYSK